MNKSRDAFRTISEVADWLDTPAHVLRFWESKFTQVKPVKRAGGRRYYRPADMELLGGIKTLLHDEGMTIKGVQKILREQGVKHVAAMSSAIDDTQADMDTAEGPDEAPFEHVQDDTDTVVPFAVSKGADKAAETGDTADDAVLDTAPDSPGPDGPMTSEPIEPTEQTVPAEIAETASMEPVETRPELDAETCPESADETIDECSDPDPVSDETGHHEVEGSVEAPVKAEHFAQDVDDSPVPAFLQSPLEGPASAAADTGAFAESVATENTAEESDGSASVPAGSSGEQIVAPPSLELDSATERDTGTDLPTAPSGAGLSLPSDPDLDAIEITPQCLSHLSRLTSLSAEQAHAIAPLAARLRARVENFRISPPG